MTLQTGWCRKRFSYTRATSAFKHYLAESIGSVVSNAGLVSRVGHRAVSMFILGPALMASWYFLFTGRDAGYAVELMPVVAFMNEDKNIDAANELYAVSKRHALHSVHRSLAGLIYLRLGKNAWAKENIEDGMKETHVGYARYFGAYKLPIDRTSCTAYISQARLLPSQEKFRAELKSRYCAVFGGDFPPADASRIPSDKAKP